MEIAYTCLLRCLSNEGRFMLLRKLESKFSKCIIDYGYSGRGGTCTGKGRLSTNKNTY